MSIANGKQEFVKYQGLGNDFILIDNRQSEIPVFSPLEAESLCNRHFGVGADGVIFVLPGENGCDYTMRIYNSDGSEPQMCGNGIRCFAKYVQFLSSSLFNSSKYTIWTRAGEIIAIINEEGSVTVAMGSPILAANKIPTLLSPEESNAAPTTGIGELVIDIPWNISPEISFLVTAVSMGNPHAVVFVEDLEKLPLPLANLGPLCEHHAAFPERVNTEFVQVYSPSHVRMLVWERGAGATMACGTGACAVVVAGCLTGRCQRQCRVSLPGGDLLIDWQESDNVVYMTGPAEPIFQGTISMPFRK